MDTMNPGSIVMYGLHGKCLITAVETKNIGGETQSFYKLEPIRSPLARTTRQTGSILVPQSVAQRGGIRLPLQSADAPAIMAILGNREYYFDLYSAFSLMQPQLERCIALEGATGLAKVISYLTALKKLDAVPASEIVRFSETVWKLLSRELSEALDQQPREVEAAMNKALKAKLLPDN